MDKLYEKEPIISYKICKDEELIEYIRSGDMHCLDFMMEKYRKFVAAKANKYFLIGGDKEDIIQEGMIGLYKAIRDFRIEETSTFFSFADLCITRQIITAIKSSTRKKHQPMNSYISLDKPIYDEDSHQTLKDVIPAKVSDPIHLLIEREMNNELDGKMGRVLTQLEKRVLQLYLNGQSYAEMSQLLNKHVKSIDNALQRVKKKLEKQLDPSFIQS